MLDFLSKELIHLVCRQLQDSLDVTRFRLVCKKFAEVGHRSLLPRLTIVPLPKAFNHLREVANHPVLRHYVEEVVFLTKTLPSYESVDDLCEDLGDPAPSTPKTVVSPDEDSDSSDMQLCLIQYDRHQWPEADVEIVWKRYKELYDAQMMRRQSCSDAEISVLLAKLPRLRTVRIEQPSGAIEPSNPFWPISEYSIPSRNLLTECSRHRESESSLLQSDMLLATILANTAIRDFSATHLSPEFSAHKSVLTIDSMRGFKNLRTISLWLSIGNHFGPSWDQCRQLLKMHTVQHILRSAPRLEAIEFAGPQLFDEEPVVEFDSTFDGIIWSRLNKMHLEGFATTSQSLITFLEEHSKILKTLELHDIQLNKQGISGWLPFFVSIASFLNLAEASFHGFFTTQLSIWGSNYISMDDKIADLELTLGEALRVLFCHLPSNIRGTNHTLIRETFEDLLSHGETRSDIGSGIYISVRHPELFERGE